MSEKKRPTYEEKVRALKETRIIWRNKLKEPSATHHCPLCTLKVNRCIEDCPIGEKTGQAECWGTPYHKWDRLRSTESVKEMIMFLDDLYIEMLEKGRPRNICKDCYRWVEDECDFDGECPHRPKIIGNIYEEKKEEWVVCNDELGWRHREDGIDGFGVLVAYHNGTVIGHIGARGTISLYNDSLYKIEKTCPQGYHFRILKRVK